MSDSPSQTNGLPNPEEILSSPGFDDSGTDEFQEYLEKRSANDFVAAEMGWVHLKGLEDHYRHKGVWSWFLMGLLSVMILFQSALLWCVGLGVWDFTKYEWLLPALLVQNLGQIIALAYVVVKSLFR